MILSNRIMRVQSGMVVGVPISAKDEMNAAHIEVAIQQALQEANALRLAGKGMFCLSIYVGDIYSIFADITPFLLEKVNNLTKGDSLHSSIIHCPLFYGNSF